MEVIWCLKFLKHDKISGTICISVPTPNSVGTRPSVPRDLPPWMRHSTKVPPNFLTTVFLEVQSNTKKIRSCPLIQIVTMSESLKHGSAEYTRVFNSCSVGCYTEINTVVANSNSSPVIFVMYTLSRNTEIHALTITLKAGFSTAN